MLPISTGSWSRATNGDGSRLSLSDSEEEEEEPI